MARLLVLAAALVAALVAAAPSKLETDGVPGAPEARVYQPALLKQPDLKWWQTGIVYQIYPASFKDSDSDGIGDLKGITSKLEYLRDLGVAALWLSPIYKSPDKDMGYDISDYKDIHPNYGTLEDFDEMVEKAHNLGLKVVLDFVPNHSSDEHKWFKEALKGPDNAYHDYYVWHEGKEVDGERKPPTNWGSVFDDYIEGSAWTWVNSLNKYYLRTFHQGQPDLNYRNPAVVREMKNVFRFWARKGVDGFRIDAIPYLFEDRLMRDNPSDSSQYTENVEETYDMVRQWRQVFDEEGERLGKDLVMMLEAYASEEQTMKYFGTKDFPSGHFPFNFFFISNLNETSNATEYVKQIYSWTDRVPAFGWSNWVVGNHDNHRVGSRLGEDHIDGINMLVTLLPGTAVTYYGEEIGMLDNTDLKLKDCKDPQACPSGADEQYYLDHSRDYERTPFQWDASEHAGFTNGTPWLPVASNYEQLNVEAQLAEENSHIKIYQKLAELRKEHVVQNGRVEAHDDGDVVTFLRQNGTYSLLVLINLGEETTVNAVELYGNLGDLKNLVSYNFENQTKNLRSLHLPKNAAVVLGGPRFKWWQTGVVYQIYPRSFKDSDDNGIGDIKGITSELDYLKNLGVNTVWLSPIFTSPDIDMGYDISDFRGIHKDFGTMEDFHEMVTRAHELGLKVVLDFVPNHSSDEHEWFRNSNSSRDSFYSDYYVWQDPKEPETNESEAVPPNDWESIFGGSAWTYNPEREQFYLHQFHEKQPDLNYRNDSLVNEIKDVIKFWLERGVDGFRVDAVHHLFEDKDFTDGYDNRVHQPETIDMVQQWRELMDEESDDLLLMLEVWGNETLVGAFFGEAERPGGHFPFNFFLISDLPDVRYGALDEDSNEGDGDPSEGDGDPSEGDGDPSEGDEDPSESDEDNETKTLAEVVRDAIEKWDNTVPEYGWSNWVFGNHDKHRIGSRCGETLIDAFNMLVTLLPGTAITYYGEEIGMLDNVNITVAECQDKQACPNGDETDVKYFMNETRDFQRTPFQWSHEEHAGFCNCNEEYPPWLPVNSDYETLNAEEEESTRRSHLFNYKKLVNLRKEPAIQSGNHKVHVLDSDVLCMARKNESYAYLVLINFGDTDLIVNAAEIHEDVGAVKEYVSYNFIATTVDLSAVNLPSKASVVLEGAIRKLSTEPEDLKWWQSGVIYQVYPRSFQDSDGDGIGDLPGITSRLPYLRDLGITAVWLSPIFSSPDADMGYDISDFQNINDIFGTLGDFDEMVQEAHRLGLKIVLDFVPNHSSDEHFWFQQALEHGKASPFYDYYVWHEGYNDSYAQPNNWESAFMTDVPGSAWTRIENDNVNASYLHQFHEKQPDLNYNNPAVVQMMKNVLSFWVHRGVDGFRVDAIQHLAEDPDFSDNTEGSDRDMQMNQPLTYEIIKQWRDLLDREGAMLQKDLALMLEVYTEEEPLMKYFGGEFRRAGDFPFNFFIISEVDEDNVGAEKLLEVIELWENARPDYGWSNWVVGNHDNHRVGSRVGEELIDAFNMMVMLLPGTAITYNGEEIGMLDNLNLTIDDCQDPQACLEGFNETVYQDKSRDFERTPFQWDDSPNAGFTTGKPWLPVNDNYNTTNVKAEEADPSSHLNVYKKLTALRKEQAIQRGDFHIERKDNVLIFSRRNVSHAYVVVINFDSSEKTVDLKEFEAYEDLPKMLKYVSSPDFSIEEGEEVDVEELTLPKLSAVVLTSEPVVDDEDFSDPTEVTTPSISSVLAPSALLFFALLPLSWLIRA